MLFIEDGYKIEHNVHLLERLIYEGLDLDDNSHGGY